MGILGDNLTLALRVKADANQATKTFSGLEKHVEETTQAISRDLTDISVKSMGDKLQKELEKSLDSYEDTLRKFKPKIQELSKDLLLGSTNQDDYDRRLKLLAPSIQDLIRDSRDLGKGISEVGEQSKDTSSDLERLFQAFSLNKSQAAGLASALPIVGAVLTTTAVAITGVSVAMFQAAKASAEYTGEVSKASQQTGIAVETMSALRYASEQTHTSFDDVTEAISEFSKTVADAATGSDDAKEKLKRLGIDPQAAIKDLEGNFEKAIQKILSLPDAVSRAKAANDAFGDSGNKLIPFLRSFDGNLNQLIKTAKELGVTLTDADVKAAKEFDKALTSLYSVSAGLVRQFTQGLLPALTTVINETKKFATENKKDIKSWGDYTGNIILGLIGYWKDLQKARSDYQKNTENIEANGLPPEQTGMPSAKAVYQYQQQSNLWNAITNSFKPVADKLVERGQQLRKENEPPKTIDYSRPQDKKIDVNSPEYLANLKEQERLAKEREELDKRELSAKIERLRRFVQQAESIYNELTQQIRKEFEDDSNSDAFVAKINSATVEYQKQLNAVYPELDKLLREQTLREKKGANERYSVYEQEQQERKKRYDDINKSINENERLLTENTKKVEKERVKIVTDSVKTELALREAANQTLIARAESLFTNDLIDESKLLKTKQGLQAIFAETNKQPQYDDNANEIFQVSENGFTKNISLISGFLKFKLEALKTELEAVKGNAEEEARINKELAQLKIDIERTYYTQKKESDELNIETTRKNAEEEKKYLEDILRLKYELLQVEQDLAKIRAEGVRNELERKVQQSINKSEPLENLRDFDSLEAMRQNARSLLAIDDARQIELSKINAIKKEEEKLKQIALINRKYEEEELIAIEQYEQRKREIKDRYQGDINVEKKRELGGGFYGGLADSLGMDISDEMQAEGEIIKGVYKDLAETAGAAVGSMIRGAGQLLQTWIMTGKLSGQAVKQMVASIISSIAVEAGIKALFQLAEGFAASAVFNYKSAAEHFAAAKIYGVVAGVATGAGLAIGAAGGFASSEKSNSETISPTTSTQKAKTGIDEDATRIITEERNRSNEAVEQDRNRIISEMFKNALRDRTIKLEVASNDAHIIRVVSDDINDRGTLDSIIIKRVGDA